MVVESYNIMRKGHNPYIPLLDSIENDNLLTIFNKINRKFKDKWFTGYEFNDDKSITLRIEYLNEPKSHFLGNYELMKELYEELKL